MRYKYSLPEDMSSRILNMEEFANGATQVTISLKGGRIINQVLLSQSKYIIAIRGYKDLPFNIEDITDIYQRDDDKNPVNRGGWDYWDKW